MPAAEPEPPKGASELTQTWRAAECGQNGIAYIKDMHDIRNIIKTYKDIFCKAANQQPHA